MMRHQRHPLKKTDQFNRWLLFIIIMIGMVIDMMIDANLAVARGVFAGALIAYGMQWVFAKLSYRHLRVSGKQMMANMYLGMLVRWVLGIVGFLLTFVLIKPMPVAVFVGFLSMQAVIFLSLYRLGKLTSL